MVYVYYHQGPLKENKENKAHFIVQITICILRIKKTNNCEIYFSLTCDPERINQPAYLSRTIVTASQFPNVYNNAN